MNEEALKELLQDADRAADGPLPLPADLTRRVRERAGDRRRVRFGAAPIAAAILLVIVWAQLLDPDAMPSANRPTTSGTRAAPVSVRVTEGPNAALVRTWDLPGAPRSRSPAAGALSEADAARIERELVALDREAMWRLATIRRTRELLQQTPSPRRSSTRISTSASGAMAESAVLLAAQAQVDRAASILVKEAHRMARDPRLRKDAIDKLQRVMRNFPQTPWATVAREKLTELLELSGVRTWQIT